MGRRRYIAIAAIACVALAGYVVWREFPRDRVSPTGVDEAVRTFRARATRPLTDRPGEPTAGVYRYATRGGESVDAAVGILSTEHSFRGVSTIAVIPTACGAIERWQVLTTRWMEIASCLGRGGQRLLSVDEMHEFFGVMREVKYRCWEPVRLGPTDLRPGMRWSGHCESNDSSRESSFHVLGFESVRVGDQDFEAVHTRTDYRLLGAYSGSAAEEEWRRRSDGLLLRRLSKTHGHSGGAVAADYEERYSLRLTSPRPQR